MAENCNISIRTLSRGIILTWLYKQASRASPNIEYDPSMLIPGVVYTVHLYTGLLLLCTLDCTVVRGVSNDLFVLQNRRCQFERY